MDKIISNIADKYEARIESLQKNDEGYIVAEIYRDGIHLLTIHTDSTDTLIVYLNKVTDIININIGKNSSLIIKIDHDLVYNTVRYQSLIIDNLEIGNNLIVIIQPNEYKYNIQYTKIYRPDQEDLSSTVLIDSNITWNRCSIWIQVPSIYIHTNECLIQDSTLSIYSADMYQNYTLFEMLQKLYYKQYELRNKLKLTSNTYLHYKYSNSNPISKGTIYLSCNADVYCTTYYTNQHNYIRIPVLSRSRLTFRLTDDIGNVLGTIEDRKTYPTLRIPTYYNNDIVFGTVENGISKYYNYQVIIYTNEMGVVHVRFIMGDETYTVEEIQENYKNANQFDVKIEYYIQQANKLQSYIQENNVDY